MKRKMRYFITLLSIVVIASISYICNGIETKAANSVVQFGEGDERTVEIGESVIVHNSKFRKDGVYDYSTFCIYKKTNMKTPVKKITNIYAESVVLTGKKLYWMGEDALYSYDVEGCKKSAVCKMDAESILDSGNISLSLRISDFIAIEGKYLYYNICVGAGALELYQIDIQQGKHTKVTDRSLEFIGSYKGYLYGYEMTMDFPSLTDIVRIKLGDKTKVDLLAKDIAGASVKRIGDKIYYMKFKLKGENSIHPETESVPFDSSCKITTSLYSCKLDGTSKKRLKTWNKKTMYIEQVRKNSIYLKRFETKNDTIYKYDINKKKVTQVKKMAKPTGIAVRQNKYRNTKSCTVTWKDDGIHGLQIVYATKKDFSDKKTSKNLWWWKNYTVLKNLKAGKTYYIKLRYANRGNKKMVYSPYSKAYKISIKK